MYADLHLHSTFSDGTDSPPELCRLAADNGVKVISITDHDSVEAHKSLASESIPHNIGIIPGLEISTSKNRKMLHILGYFIDVYNHGLVSLLNLMAEERTESTRLNFKSAVSQGVFSYEWERVIELNPGQPRIGGTSVVKAMQTDGYEVPGMGLWDMFRRFFWPANDGYISVESVGADKAIDVIGSSGGIPVVAHPGDIKDDAVVAGLIRMGARGLEAFHPCHSKDDTERYLRIARQERLFITGGSDWHGGNSQDGKYFAMCGLTDEKYDILKQGNTL